MKIRTVLLCALIGAAPYIAAMPYAAAQTDQYEPQPCTACDADNAGPGKGSGFFLASQCSTAHDGTGRMQLTFSNHEPLAVEATVNGQMQTIAPGAKGVFYVPFSGPEVVITRSAVRVDGKVIIAEKTRIYPCPCENTTTTVPSTPSTPPPTATGSSVPPGSSTPLPSTPGGTPTTVAFELPATGTTSAGLVLGATLLAFFGFCGWLLGRGGEQVER